MVNNSLNLATLIDILKPFISYISSNITLYCGLPAHVGAWACQGFQDWSITGETYLAMWGGGGAPSSVTYIFIILKIAIVSNIQSITYKEEVPISSSKANIPIWSYSYWENGKLLIKGFPYFTQQCGYYREA